MARTSISEVKNIIDTDLTDPQVQSYIDTATAFIDTTIAGKLGSTILAQIEKWLTAHFIASTQERMPQKAGAGPASITFFGNEGMALNGTPYGQQVVALDSTGTLSSLSQGRVKGFLEAL